MAYIKSVAARFKEKGIVVEVQNHRVRSDVGFHAEMTDVSRSHFDSICHKVADGSVTAPYESIIYDDGWRVVVRKENP